MPANPRLFWDTWTMTRVDVSDDVRITAHAFRVLLLTGVGMTATECAEQLDSTPMAVAQECKRLRKTIGVLTTRELRMFATDNFPRELKPLCADLNTGRDDNEFPRPIPPEQTAPDHKMWLKLRESGVPVAEIAARYGRKKNTVYVALSRQRRRKGQGMPRELRQNSKNAANWALAFRPDDGGCVDVKEGTLTPRLFMVLMLTGVGMTVRETASYMSRHCVNCSSTAASQLRSRLHKKTALHSVREIRLYAQDNFGRELKVLSAELNTGRTIKEFPRPIPDVLERQAPDPALWLTLHEQDGLVLREIGERFGYTESGVCRVIQRYRQQMAAGRIDHKASDTPPPE